MQVQGGMTRQECRGIFSLFTVVMNMYSSHEMSGLKRDSFLARLLKKRAYG